MIVEKNHETPKNYSSSNAHSNSNLSCKSVSTKLDNLLERIPDISWGIIGDKFPAFTTFITVALIAPLIILGFTSLIVLSLCELAFLFPLNYLVAFVIMLPVILVWLSVQYKISKRLRQTLLKPTKHNPDAIREYKDLINR